MLLRFILLFFFIGWSFLALPLSKTEQQVIRQLENQTDSLKFKFIRSILVKNQELSTDRKGVLHYLLGQQHLYNLEYVKAWQELTIAGELIGSSEYLAYKGRARMYLSYVNIHFGRTNQALSDISEALRISEHDGDEYLTMWILSSFGSLYYEYEDFERGVEYVDRAFAIAQERKDTVALFIHSSNLAVFHLGNDSIALAEKCLNESKYYLNFLESDSSDWGAYYDNKGLVQQAKGEFELSIQSFVKANELLKRWTPNNTDASFHLGEIYFELGDFKKSKYFFNQANLPSNSIVRKIKIIDYLLLIAQYEKDISGIRHYNERRNFFQKKEEKIDVENREQLFEKELEFIETRIDLEAQVMLNNKNRIILWLSVVMTILVVLIFVVFWKNKKFRFEKEKLQLNQKLNTIKMNPHFLFNTLSNIQTAILKKDPLTSAKLTAEFGELIRLIFIFSSKEQISIEDELKFIQLYIKMQQLRLDKGFKFELNVDESIKIDNMYLPPMMLQPFVENAIKHGFKEDRLGHEISLRIFRDGHLIQFEIKDNGKGFNIGNLDESREHSFVIFQRRLSYRKLNEEKHFFVDSSFLGTIIAFKLNLD